LTKSLAFDKMFYANDHKGGFFMRKKIILICEECLARNYTTTKNVKTTTSRLELKKYCKHCNKSTIHKETK
jgi:large subunit ribosomal protein L33